MLGLGEKAVRSARELPGAVWKAAQKEAGTEGFQELAEYAGTNLGTDRGFDPGEAMDRALAGAVAGAGMGGVVRTGTGALEMRRPSRADSEQPEAPADESQPSDIESEQPSPANLDPSSVASAVDLIRQPRHALDAEQRVARDSATDGEAFQALRSAAEQRGDNEAVAELDSIGSDIGAALEEETLLRSRGESTDVLQPRLDELAQRYEAVAVRINGQDQPKAASVQQDVEPVAEEPAVDPQQEAEGQSPRQPTLGIDNDIRIAEKIGADEDAIRLRNAKNLFIRAMEQDAAGNNDAGSRLRERGLNIYRDIYGDPESPMPERPASFPVPYEYVGDVEAGGQLPVQAARQDRGETYSGEPDPALAAPAPQLRQGDQATGEPLIYGQGPTVRRGNADTGMDQPFAGARTTDTAPAGELKLRVDGTPFETQRQATISKAARGAKRDGQEVEVVPVDGGGFGVRIAPNPKTQQRYALLQSQNVPLRSVVTGDDNAPGISLEEAQQVADDFLAGYNGNVPLDLHVVARQEDVYGPEATRERVGTIKGAYHAKSGKLVLAASSLRDARDARATLAHEVLGHYGLNTFAPDQKRQILDSILAVADDASPSLAPYWAHVRKNYPDAPRDVQAEEVFAKAAEYRRDKLGQAWDKVLTTFQKALRKTGLIKTPLKRAKLHDMIRTMSRGIAEGERPQRTFPESDNSSFSRSDAEPAVRASGKVAAADLAAAIAKQPELSGIRIVQSVDDLPAINQAMIRRDGVNPADVQGIHDPNTGENYIIADNLESMEDGLRNAVHEAVGHKGIRGVLGEELGPVMRQIYNSHLRSAAGRHNLRQIKAAYPFIDTTTPEGRQTLAEELVAGYLEGDFGRPGLRQRIVSAIRAALRKRFPNIRWTTKDIQALGEQARKWLRRQAPGRNSEDGDALYSLKKPESADSAVGPYSENDSTGFALPDEALTETAVRKMQDKMGRLKKTVETINARGGRVTDENNAYLAEELFHGKIENDLRLLRETYVEPMAKKLAQYNISQDQLDDYLYARHAPERNAVIAQRNADMPDGGSGMTNAEAAKILDEVQASGKKAQYDEVAEFVYGMLRASRDAMRQGGLASDEMLSDWESTYQYYVPLKGDPKKKGRKSGDRSSQGYNISGKESKLAGGRRSRAESPSSHAIIDTTQSLIRKRKNEVGNSLLSLVTDNPDPSLWQVFTEGQPDMERRPVEVSDGQGGTRIEVRDQPVPMHMSDQYFATKRGGRTYYIKIEDPLLMRAMKNLGPEKVDGMWRVAAGTTRVMSALNTSLNPEFMLTNFSRDIQTAILNISAEQTREDGKLQGEHVAAQTVKDVGTSMRAIHASMRGRRLSGKGAEWQQFFDEFQADGAKTGWYDAKDIEGQAKDIRRLMTMAGNSTVGRTLRYRHAVGKFVEDANATVENAVRLSAYVNARRAGISRAKAASLAKNLTVNFNRRGEVGTKLNAAYMFANASIQGTANFVRTMGSLRGPEHGRGWNRLNGAQKLAVYMMAGAYGLAMLNRWASEEDDDGVLFYDKIPDYVKERNIILMSSLWGGDPKDYIKIPMPYGYNIFGVLGTQAEAVVSGQKSWAEAGKNMTLATVGAFSPIGWEDSDDALGLFKNVVPSIARPVAQLLGNSDFAGRPIYRENAPYGTPKPDSALSFHSTPEPYKGNTA